MKANKAPEKIWLGKSTQNLMLFDPNSNTYVEYTRTDAFVEKTADYFNSQLYDWVSITNPDQRSCANVIPKKDFIEKFISYMKGE